MLAAAIRSSRVSSLATVQRSWARSYATDSPTVFGMESLLAAIPKTAPPKGRGHPRNLYPKRNDWSFKIEPAADLPETRLRLHCHSTPNNTISTLTKADGSTIAWFSGGSCGFKKGNRATYEAGYQCAVRCFKQIEELAKTDGNIKVDLFFKGFGQGREALKIALLASEGERVRELVATITDRTPIKIGGTRAKKMPRN
ncbi:hypothetical protein DFP72DRAFT_957041 [Ephemerocybe angulata]|uniref:Mitochondrial ribosomal protein S11 n=1 Tax=Ephemerocybe angulata TaxID=980116 RepID=A0A8H6IBM4_9AGAR|nr:hypothetical protein DFP72DRAFT_957041 [Tulosesus angulatus]